MKNKLWDLVPFMALAIFAMSILLMVVNIVYMGKMNNTIDTMWHEIRQVKETNISLFQFIEEHGDDITGR
jgi:hypothetical protein|tara:strand:- start:832 stop:1041 length:210 start_codon:yes stop_codon:yes gene_type:complete